MSTPVRVPPPGGGVGADDNYARGIALSAAGILLVSPDGLLIRLVDDAGVFQIVFFRMLFLGLTLLLALGIFYGRRVPRVMTALGWRGLATSVLMAGSNFGFVGAMLHTSIANTLVILALIPLFGALFSRLLLGERIRRHTAIAILIAFVGVLVMVSGSIGRPNLLGDSIALLAAMAQGLNLAILRGAGDRDSTPALCASGFLGALAALPLAGGLAVSAHDLGVLFVNGGLQLPLAIALFIAGTRYAPAPDVGLMVLLETVLGPLWGWLGVGEVPPPQSFLGGAVVLAAIAMNSAASIRVRRRRETWSGAGSG